VALRIRVPRLGGIAQLDKTVIYEQIRSALEVVAADVEPAGLLVSLVHLFLLMAVSLRVRYDVDKQLRERVDPLVQWALLDRPWQMGIPARLVFHAEPLHTAFFGTGNAIEGIFVAAAIGALPAG
jgi:hypothetical protein